MQNTGKGVYVMVMRLSKPTRLTVGRLGIFHFPTGYYLYVGSALAGFAGRINRHLKKKKKRRWHIDYLLEVSEILWVDLYETSSHEDECRLNKAVSKLPNAKIICAKFGSSDCRCRAHLHFFEALPSLKFRI